ARSARQVWNCSWPELIVGPSRPRKPRMTLVSLYDRRRLRLPDWCRYVVLGGGAGRRQQSADHKTSRRDRRRTAAEHGLHRQRLADRGLRIWPGRPSAELEESAAGDFRADDNMFL